MGRTLKIGFVGALLCLIAPASFVQGVLASSFNPTVLVNTEAFEIIDDHDSTANVSLKFGDTLAKTITYNRTTARFEFSDNVSVTGDLRVTGTASGTNITASSLKNCDTIDTNANGVLACGTDAGGAAGVTLTDGDARYVNQSGDTMTGALRLNVTNGNFSTLGLRVNNTASGAQLHAEQTLTSSGQLIVEGNLTFGDALADAITVNAGSWTFANDTNFVLSGGVNGLSFDTSTLSVDATNHRIGIGTTTPRTPLEVQGTISGATVYATRNLLASGALVVTGNGKFDGGTMFIDSANNKVGVNTLSPKTPLEVVGAMSGVSLTTSDLRNCDTIDTNANGVLACGTDAGGGFSFGAAEGIYVNQRGDTMTGALTIDIPGSTGTGLIIRERTYLGSGATLSGSLIFRERSDPEAPSSNTLAIYSKNVAGRLLLKGKSPSGLDYPYQPAIFGNNVAVYYPASTTTAGQVTGWTFTSAGTVSHPAQATTNLLTTTRRTRWASATTANAIGGLVSTTPQCWRGNAARLGGFFFFARFGQNVNTNGARAFVGLAALTTSLVAAEPSAALNMVGMGYDAADASTGNWKLMYNDGAGAATKTDLGTGAARNTTDLYSLYIFAPPNGTTITVRVVNESTNTVVLHNSVLSTDLLTNTTFLTVHAAGGPAASAAAQNFELNRLYLESDY